nr:biotin/lipoyl-binding protein [Halomonas massiliensis]
MFKATAVLLALLLLAGCSEESSQRSVKDAPRWVKTAPVSPVSASTLSLTGVVRARYETPQAFRVSGQIASRHVDAGQRVRAGDVLFTLDPRDLEEALAAAKAELNAAEATLAVVRADLARDRQLLEKNFLSRQAFERAELAVREAAMQRDAASARVAQARHALEYAHPPPSGELLQGERRVALSRREVAGAADPASRTWRARYRLETALTERGLGEVVQARFTLDEAEGAGRFRVPVAALDERGDGPQLWHIVEGQAEPLPVALERMTREHAWVRGEALRDGQAVIALGTHLLTPGMAVRPLGEEAPE